MEKEIQQRLYRTPIGNNGSEISILCALNMLDAVQFSSMKQ